MGQARGQGDHLQSPCPDAKGLVEGLHGYVAMSLLRESFFVWPTDFNVNRSVSGLVSTRLSLRIREEAISYPSPGQALAGMPTSASCLP